MHRQDVPACLLYRKIYFLRGKITVIRRVVSYISTTPEVKDPARVWRSPSFESVEYDLPTSAVVLVDVAAAAYWDAGCLVARGRGPTAVGRSHVPPKEPHSEAAAATPRQAFPMCRNRNRTQKPRGGDATTGSSTATV